MTRFILEDFAKSKHSRKNFSSGNERVDNYFQNNMSQDVKSLYASCRVLIERNSGKVAGFYTLSAYAIPLGEIPAEIAKRIPRYPMVPAALIGWLGRDLAFRGEGIGPILLYDAFKQASKSPLGAYAICADAISNNAVKFYLDHQFQGYASQPNRLFLPIATALSILDA